MTKHVPSFFSLSFLSCLHSPVRERESKREYVRLGERVRVLLLSFSSCDLLILYSLHEGEFRDKGRNWECLWVREGERESVSLLGWIYAHFSIPAPGGSSSSYLTWLTQISEMVSILWLAVVKEIWDECCKTFLNTILATMYLLYVCDEDMWQELWLQDRYLISIHN